MNRNATNNSNAKSINNNNNMNSKLKMILVNKYIYNYANKHIMTILTIRNIKTKKSLRKPIHSLNNAIYLLCTFPRKIFHFINIMKYFVYK